MHINVSGRSALVLIAIVFTALESFCQSGVKWSSDGNSYTKVENGEIVQYLLPANTNTVLISKDKLVPPGQSAPYL